MAGLIHLGSPEYKRHLAELKIKVVAVPTFGELKAAEAVKPAEAKAEKSKIPERKNQNETE